MTLEGIGRSIVKRLLLMNNSIKLLITDKLDITGIQQVLIHSITKKSEDNQ